MLALFVFLFSLQYVAHSEKWRISQALPKSSNPPYIVGGFYRKFQYQASGRKTILEQKAVLDGRGLKIPFTGEQGNPQLEIVYTNGRGPIPALTGQPRHRLFSLKLYFQESHPGVWLFDVWDVTSRGVATTSDDKEWTPAQFEAMLNRRGTQIRYWPTGYFTGNRPPANTISWVLFREEYKRFEPPPPAAKVMEYGDYQYWNADDHGYYDGEDINMDDKLYELYEDARSNLAKAKLQLRIARELVRK